MTDLRQAAQQALEALSDIEWSNDSQWQSDRAKVAIIALCAALEEPEEPVAWQWLDTAHFRKKIPADATPSDWRPLYTAPPQRKPLTEEEIDAIPCTDGPGSDWDALVRFARAIEKAHGIGGEA